VHLTARAIAELIGGQLAGNPDVTVTGVAGIREAEPGEITFLANPKYLAAARATRASVIILDRASPLESSRTLIRVDDPLRAFARVVERLVPPPVRFPPGIHPTAVVAASARLGAEVCIQPHAVIEPDVLIGDRTVIGAGCYIGHGSRIGADCLLYPRVTLRERSQLGDRVILHSGVVIGADGFGYELTEGQHQKIPQVGHVEIGDDVEIGANSTVDRGRFGRTRVGRGTKIDNHVQIAHNCIIGEDNIICAGTGLAGSVITARHVTMAGQVGVVGHVTIGEKAIIMAQSAITKDVPPGAILLGSPAMPHKQFKRIRATMNVVPELAEKVRQLQRQIEELRARLDPSAAKPINPVSDG
jgi:UDP-3-O-[3-hydroxymyristoyl] glucosamine N-acyltransferase